MLRVTLLAMLLLGVSAFAADRSGEYVGTYTSTEGDSAGQLRIVIQKSADGWSCKVFFTAGGDEVATKPGACSVENDQFSTEFDATVEDTTMHAKLKGAAVDDKSFEGTYTTAGAGGDGGDQGKWKVALKH